MSHTTLKRTDYCYSYSLSGNTSRFEMSYKVPQSGQSESIKKNSAYQVRYQSVDGSCKGAFDLLVEGQTDKLRTVCNIPGYIYHIESPTGEKVTITNKAVIGYN